MPHWRRAVQVYREQGLGQLIRKTWAYVHAATKLRLGELYVRCVPPLPPLTLTKSVHDTIGEFRVATALEVPRVVNTETQLEDFLLRLDEDDVVFDVGANVGLYTVFASRCLSDATVYSFEPLPENAERLRENLRLNGASAHVFKLALSNENGRASLRVPERTTGEGKGSIAGADEQMSAVTVRTRTGDDLVRDEGVPIPNVVKIDVEGAEYEVLDGMREILDSGQCRLVYCEVHSPYGQSSDVEDLLDAYGYDVECVERKSGGYWIRATNSVRKPRHG